LLDNFFVGPLSRIDQLVHIGGHYKASPPFSADVVNNLAKCDPIEIAAKLILGNQSPSIVFPHREHGVLRDVFSVDNSAAPPNEFNQRSPSRFHRGCKLISGLHLLLRDNNYGGHNQPNNHQEAEDEHASWVFLKVLCQRASKANREKTRPKPKGQA
jgi:hypothetical protein